MFQFIKCKYFFLTVRVTYILVSQKTEHSSDADNMNISPTKRQKTLVIDSDMEHENETHGAGEDFTGVASQVAQW